MAGLRAEYGLGVPPNFQRFLPIILIAFVLLFILPTVLKKKSSTGPNTKTRAADTISALNLVGGAEKDFLAAHDRYTAHLADLIPLRKQLVSDLSIGLGVQLDVSTDGKTYYAQVASDVLSLTRARNQSKIIASGCLVLKSGTGVKCPV